MLEINKLKISIPFKKCKQTLFKPNETREYFSVILNAKFFAFEKNYLLIA